jgi:hypothetical protein
MEQMTADIAQETRRMELRGVVLVAGEVIAQYWPMRTFVHHNPLHSLEYLPFEETVRRGRLFLGGQGYLSGDTYRAYLRSGRIRVHHLEEALGDRAQYVPMSDPAGADRDIGTYCAPVSRTACPPRFRNRSTLCWSRTRTEPWCRPCPITSRRPCTPPR